MTLEEHRPCSGTRGAAIAASLSHLNGASGHRDAEMAALGDLSGRLRPLLGCFPGMTMQPDPAETTRKTR